MDNIIARLGLGTVQFGVDYGISNSEGKTPEDESRNVLALAHRMGIRVLDTAALYGDSESVLGRFLSGHGNGFNIVTKTIQLAGAQIDDAGVKQAHGAFLRSLDRLQCGHVYGLLVHQADDLLKSGGDKLYDWLLGLKKTGKTRKIGVSVYTPEQLEKVIDRFSMDIAQVPVNVFDQRFRLSGMLSGLKQRGVEIHARSVFLQGLLLMDSNRLSSCFNHVLEHIAGYHEFLDARGLDRLQGALLPVLMQPEIDVVLCGVNDHYQLEEISDAVLSGASVPDMGDFALNDPAVLDPSSWALK